MADPAPSSSLSISRQEKIITAGIIVGFVMLALGFSLSPIFEGQDEDDHYYYIHYLATEHQLPDPLDPTHWEFRQPPLYYALGVPVVWLAGDGDLEQIHARMNPYREIQVKSSPDNLDKNLYVHQTDEAFPFLASQTTFANHLLRLYSVALGMGTLLICAHIFREFWPQRPERRLLALGLAAFWPIMSWHFAMINNDHPATFLITWSLLLMLRQARLGSTWRRSALLGLVVGAALLAKSSALILAIPAAATVLSDRRAWRYGLLSLAVVLAVAGWWYARNVVLLHDLTGNSAHLVAQPWDRYVATEHSLDENLKQIAGYLQRGWANYGSEANITVAPVFYGAAAVLLCASLAGLAVRGMQWLKARMPLPVDACRKRQQIVIIAFASALTAGWIYYPLSSTLGAQGRFLLMGISLLPAAAALGLEVWIPAKLRLRSVLSTTALLALMAAVGLCGYYLPAFRIEPMPVHIEYPLGVRYAETLELVGVNRQEITARPGETIAFTLYWRSLKLTDADLIVQLHSTGNTLFVRTSFPAGGNLRSTTWQAGQSWAEHYRVTIPTNARPGKYLAIAIVADNDTHNILALSDSAGSGPTEPVFAQIAISGGP